jgi:hypothetical protein
MKTKEYIELATQKHSYEVAFNHAKINDCLTIDIIKNKDKANDIQKQLDALNNVCVSYYIGYYKKYKKVIKIGKSYFDGKTKMTAARGYTEIKEIAEITYGIVKALEE